jgi:hypothetical protein
MLPSSAVTSLGSTGQLLTGFSTSTSPLSDMIVIRRWRRGVCECQCNVRGMSACDFEVCGIVFSRYCRQALHVMMYDRGSTDQKSISVSGCLRGTL